METIQRSPVLKWWRGERRGGAHSLKMMVPTNSLQAPVNGRSQSIALMIQRSIGYDSALRG